MSLMQERRYDDITVQDIIDRADVGRSTFYAHYQDKEDLLINSVMRLMDYLTQAVLQPNGEVHRLLPMRELFEHVEENRPLIRSLIQGRGFELFTKKGQAFWSQKVAEALQARLPDGQAAGVPIDVMAQFAAGTMVSMLRWWLDNKAPYSPEEMDEMLNRLLMSGIENGLRP